MRLLVWIGLALALGAASAKAQDLTGDGPGCDVYAQAWARVAGGTDLQAMNKIIAVIPSVCSALRSEARRRRDLVAVAQAQSDRRARGGSTAPLEVSGVGDAHDKSLLLDIVRAGRQEPLIDLMADRAQAVEMLQPLALGDIDQLLHQGYERELVFYLVIEKVKITVVTPASASSIPPQVFYNDPSNPAGFAFFQWYIKQAMEHGLTTENFTRLVGPAPAKTEANDTPTPATSQAEFCYDRALASPVDIADIPKGSFCGDRPSIRESYDDDSPADYLTVHEKTFVLHDEPLKIEIYARSVNEMFSYLGAMVKSGKPLELQPFNLPGEMIPEEPLLTIKAVHGPAGCLISVSDNGSEFCVPKQGASSTLRTFLVLNTALTLARR
jgi:hypothetical protein